MDQDRCGPSGRSVADSWAPRPPELKRWAGGRVPTHHSATLLGEEGVAVSPASHERSLAAGYGAVGSILVSDPQRVLEEIHDTLELPPFRYNTERVEQLTHESDEVHGLRDLHTLREQVTPGAGREWKDILTPAK